MATKVYGYSDDLIQVDGDLCVEIDSGYIGREVVLTFSDNTVLGVSYGKLGKAIWQISLLKKGDLFEKIEYCYEENSERYSDVSHLKDGIEWVRWEYKQ